MESLACGRAKQGDPMLRARKAWNSSPAHVRNAENKITLSAIKESN